MSCLGFFYLGPVRKAELSAFDNYAVHSSEEHTAFSTFMRVVWDNIRGYGWLQTIYLMYDLGLNRMWITQKPRKSVRVMMTNTIGPLEKKHDMTDANMTVCNQRTNVVMPQR